jgi:hypothetical protein
MINRIERSAVGNRIEIDDLGNAFTRCAVITSDSASDFSDATAAELTANGYITDEDGTIGDLEATFGRNLIW